MNNDQFWDLIAQSRHDTADDIEEQCDALTERLSGLTREELIAFDALYHDRLDQAYHWDLWAAAYILNDGCSDDGFEYFRDWLIAQGREAYENALRQPESLADIAEPYACEAEDFRYVVADVYAEKFGSDLPFSERAPAIIQGEEWDEDVVDSKYPKLSAWMEAA